MTTFALTVYRSEGIVARFINVVRKHRRYVMPLLAVLVLLGLISLQSC